MFHDSKRIIALVSYAAERAVDGVNLILKGHHNDKQRGVQHEQRNADNEDAVQCGEGKKDNRLHKQNQPGDINNFSSTIFPLLKRCTIWHTIPPCFAAGSGLQNLVASEEWGRSPALALRAVSGSRLIFLRTRETICDEREEPELD